MDWAKKIINILKEDKWDYSKLAQITSELGGPKVALIKIVGIAGAVGSFVGVTAWESCRRLIKKIKKKFNKLTPKEQQEINSRTEDYLETRKKKIDAGEDVTILDKEYDDFMKRILGEKDSDIDKKD